MNEVLFVWTVHVAAIQLRQGPYAAAYQGDGAGT